MDAQEFIRDVVERNYAEFKELRSDPRLFWNALVSMNSVAEWVALARLGYPDRDKLAEQTLIDGAKKVRQEFAILGHVKYWAETLKHVRKFGRPSDAVDLG